MADLFNVSLDYLLDRTKENTDLKWLEKEVGKLDGKPVTVSNLAKRLEFLSAESKNLVLEMIEALEFKEKHEKKS